MRDEPELVGVVARRLEFLEHLRETPAYKPALVDAVEGSRSTVDRAVDELEAAGLIERGDEGYLTTQLGRLAAERYSRLLADTQTLVEARPVIDALPPACDLPFELFDGGHVDAVDGPYGAFAALADRLSTAGHCRVVLPRLVDSRHVRLWHAQVVEGDLDVELLAPPAVLERLREEFPELTDELADADGFEAHGVDPPPYGLVVCGEDRTASAFLIAYGDDGVAGVLTIDGSDGLAWARDRCNQHRERGEVATGQLRSDGADGRLSALAGLRLPPALRSEGFVRLDREFLEGSEAMAPETSWRAGIGLPEVAAGHAVDRHQRDGTPLWETVLGRLETADVAVVGPAGSGKSTVCKQVACRWAEQRGSVLYREGGAGRTFQSTAALASAVERAKEPILIVVEDAVRSDASRVFEVMRETAEEDVRFLLDARSDEWRDPVEGILDARLDAFRREAVDVVSMPPIDDDECRRLLDGAEAVLGERVDADPAALLAAVRSAEDDGTAPGAMLLLSHRIARRVNPLADRERPTTLDEDVDRVREALSEIGETALEVGVLVNALNAAGVELEPALAYAVADLDRPAERTQVATALETLEGHVLFTQSGETRPIHESWSERFLERSVETAGEHAAADRFGRCLSALFALADEPGHCDRLARTVGRAAVFERIAASPTEWIDGVAETVFELGRTNAGLAPLFSTAEASAIELPDACSPRTELRCLELRGRTHLVAGAVERARAEFEQLRLTASERSFPEFEVEAVRQKGRIARQQGEYETAREHLERSLVMANESDDRETEAKVHNDLGAVAYHLGEYARARERYRESLELARELGDLQSEGNCLNNLGLIAWRQSDYDRAREYLEASLALYRDAGDRQAAAKSLNNLGIVARELGDYDRVREYYRESLEIRRDVGDRAGEATTLNNLGQVAHRQGRYDRAREYWERSLEIRREVGDRAGEASSLMNLGEVAHRRGHYDRASEHYQESLEIRREIGDRFGMAQSLANLGACARRQREYESAESSLEESFRLARELGSPDTELVSLQSLGALARDRGETDLARRRLEEALARSEEGVDPFVLAQCRLERARVALAGDDLAVAREQAAEARALFERVGAVHWLGRARRLLGEIAAEEENRDEARLHWEAALDRFEAVDAPQDALATLRELVVRYDGTDNQRGFERARELLTEAPDPVRDVHESWVERHTLEERTRK